MLLWTRHAGLWMDTCRCMLGAVLPICWYITCLPRAQPAGQQSFVFPQGLGGTPLGSFCLQSPLWMLPAVSWDERRWRGCCLGDAVPVLELVPEAGHPHPCPSSEGVIQVILDPFPFSLIFKKNFHNDIYLMVFIISYYNFKNLVN